jgi:glycosyltransferase involved in cell wall biosynthesis
VGTIYTMSVDRYLPTAFAVVAGTRELHEALAETRDPRAVFRLDPPVDVRTNAPDDEAGGRFRRELGIGCEERVVVVVSRLDLWLKIGSLMDAMDAVGMLAGGSGRSRLVIVGDGPARAAVARRAASVNAACGREVVTLVGPMLDPVPAYQAADVVVGMGTSILRGMAAAKPSVLVGEMGFVQIVGPSTVEPFLRQGFWGVGDGSGGGARLADAVTAILSLPGEERAALGRWGRDLVVERFGLEGSADRLLEIYERARAWSPRSRELWSAAARTPGRVLARKVHDRLPPLRRAQQRLMHGPPDAAAHESALATRRTPDAFGVRQHREITAEESSEKGASKDGR